MSPMNPIRAINDGCTILGAADRRDATPGIINASSIGYGVRRIMLYHHEDTYTPSPLTPRRARVFQVGKERHRALREALRWGVKRLIVDEATPVQQQQWKDDPDQLAADLAAILDGIPVTEDEEESWEIALIGDTDAPPHPVRQWWLVGHPDAVMPITMPGRDGYTGRAVLEIKTVSSFGWREAQSGSVSDAYMAQAQVNMHGMQCDACLFVWERKDTQAITHTLVRYDKAVAERLIEKARTIAGLLDAGYDPITEIDPCQGPDYGTSRKTVKLQGTRYETQVVNWGCSYCPYTAHCHRGAVCVLTDDGRPAWIPEEGVPADTKVLELGADVLPRDTWIMIGDEDSE